MKRDENWFKIHLKAYAALSQKQIDEIFSGNTALSRSFEVFLGRVFPDFLKDFIGYEKHILKILKKSQRRRKIQAFRKSLFG